ncbi:MAG: redox-sensing transcriptional repressor Rex [Oscillospiraceae bacterium]|jgi:redox-sensing transcriptional repressor|nr:redox-sensing transcriptional repressor Rex [Oscillospiraceae bacterium]
MKSIKNIKNVKLPAPVIKRLPKYYRFLTEVYNSGTKRISSRKLAELMGNTSSQIRQDINWFGNFGEKGHGYLVSELREIISGALGVNNAKKIVIVGAGNLGKAVGSHVDFRSWGFRVTGVFDKDPSVIGSKIAGFEVRDIAGIAGFCEDNRPVAAVLCVPRTAAEETVKLLMNCGVKAFWNFSYYNLKEEGITVQNVRLADSLMLLSHGIETEKYSD